MKHQPNLQNTDPSPAESFSKTSNRELGLTCASFLTQSRVNCRGTMLTEFNKTANNPPCMGRIAERRIDVKRPYLPCR